MSDVVYMTKVRLSFPSLVDPRAPKGTPNADKKYNCDLLMEPNHPDYAKFMGEVGAVATAKWKENAGTILKLIQPDRKLRCYGSGAEKIDKNTLKPYQGYEGMVYLSPSSREDKPPQIIRTDGSVCDNPMERQQLARKLYGGCYVNVAVRPWPQDNQFGRAIRCELIAVQFAADGTPFGESEPDMTGKFAPVVEPTAPAAVGLPWM